MSARSVRKFTELLVLPLLLVLVLRVLVMGPAHGHTIAKGTHVNAVMAELYGRGTGLVKGKGGSMHLFDVERGLMGGYGIVGGHIPLATGMGFAAKYRNTSQVAVCYFGEAAVNNGAFHEALNMAALWKLPAIYICENNRYGMGTALERASAIYDISERACSYDMANEVVDGQDVLVMHAAMERAVAALWREALGVERVGVHDNFFDLGGHSLLVVRAHQRLREARGRQLLQLGDGLPLQFSDIHWRDRGDDLRRPRDPRHGARRSARGVKPSRRFYIVAPE